MWYRFAFLFFLSISSFYAQEKPVVVLELFTSQGCSSCPPADKVLDEIKNTSDITKVIPIAYHVDYWDYIGWKDPYGSRAFSKKQNEYAEKFYSSSIYTPQLVINGDEHLVGSNRRKIHKRIKQILHRGSSSNSLKVSEVKVENNNVNFSYNINGTIRDREIYFLLAINERETEVKRGENRNRTLKNNNIVVNEVRKVLTNNSGKGTITIPTKMVKKNEGLRLVVLIKDKELTITTGAQIIL